MVKDHFAKDKRVPLDTSAHGSMTSAAKCDTFFDMQIFVRRECSNGHSSRSHWRTRVSASARLIPPPSIPFGNSAGSCIELLFCAKIIGSSVNALESVGDFTIDFGFGDDCRRSLAGQVSN